MGFFAFFQWEFSLSVLAAAAGGAGSYSVNESVVIFDRIREAVARRFRKPPDTHEVIDHAITEYDQPHHRYHRSTARPR